MKNTTLKTKLTCCIQNQDNQILIKELGYQNFDKGMNTLNKFIETKDIYEWLNNAHYDLVNSSEGLLSKLCLYFDLINDNTILEIEDAKKKIKFLNEFNKSEFSITIQTKWIRTNESITMLSIAGSSLKSIRIDKEKLYGLTEEQELEFVKSTLKEHYKKHEGKITIFGNIEYYKYTSNFGKIYRLKITEPGLVVMLSKTSITNDFYFKIIENYKYYVEEVFKIDKEYINKKIDLIIEDKITLYEFVCSVYKEYIKTIPGYNEYTNEKKKLMVKSFVLKFQKPFEYSFGFIFVNMKSNLLKIVS